MELIRSVAYPSELWALFKFRFGGGKEMVMPTLDYVSSAVHENMKKYARLL